MDYSNDLIANKHTMNCQLVNKHAMNCQQFLANKHAMNCQLANKHAMNCQLANKHAMNCQLANKHAMNCQLHRLRVRGASYLFHPESSGFALCYSHCWVRTRAKGTSAANIWESERYGQIGAGPAAVPQAP